MMNYPLSIQSFEDLRINNCIYVDKTDYVYNLISYGKTYFLARPRRFGKSLLCSTLRAYFEGKKHLFEGLKIYDLEKDWIKYPMIYLDFVSGDYTIGSITLIDKIRVARFWVGDYSTTSKNNRLFRRLRTFEARDSLSFDVPKLETNFYNFQIF